jgi:rfaE bifunctional protein nucleotidyltransferase chain/domain
MCYIKPAMDASAMLRSKILSQEELLSQAHKWRKDSKKIVFTNGCFDILHQGHVAFLAEASQLGDVLVVGINSDASVRRLGKGPSRPILGEQARANILAACFFVTGVVIFEEDTPFELIKILEPDILVKGNDWPAEKIIGRDIVIARGGTVVSLATPSYSTTAIEQKILDAHAPTPHA